MIVERLLSELGFLLETAVMAGQAILEVYKGEFRVDYKDDHSPLTEADRHSHNLIKRRLREMDSSIPLLSEEGADIPYPRRSSWPAFWLVDPLDGTKEFVNRNGEFTVNIALIENGASVVGVVYLPVKRIIYFAARGLGAFRRDGKAGLEQDSKAIIDTSQALPLSFAETGTGDSITVVASRSHANGASRDFVDRLRGFYRDVNLTPAGSSLKICLVAEGAADLYPRHGPTMEWDTGAGQCVVEQSGGRLIDLNSLEPLSYNKECLRNPFFICTRKGFSLPRECCP